MTPYEVFFFSSGGIEEKWTAKDIPVMRSNVFVGFPLGGLISLAIAATSMLVLGSSGIDVESLGQVALPVVVALGKVGLIFALVGFFAATFGAACETGLSVGYSISQYFGWQWGKFVAPRRAARFHVVMLIATIMAVGVLLTTADPIKVTEYSVVFSAVALPLTYLPILVVANDTRYMGAHVNGRLANVLGSFYLVVILIASLAAIPLMVLTKAGQ
jgi:Mn2+/Fe2+ NRAMP family transporter